MMIQLADYLQSEWGGMGFLRLFHYLSFRAMIATMTAFLLALSVSTPMIRMLYRLRLRDVVEDYGVIDVGNKRGTPTMGGLILLVTIIPSALLWCRLDVSFVWAGLAALLWFGAIGFWDDLAKVHGGGGADGLSQGMKIILQTLFALGLGLWMLSDASPLPADMRSMLYLPFYKAAVFDMGYLILPFVALVVLAISNSVNFADGMDGLATVPTAVAFMVYAVFAYVIGNAVYSQYLHFDFVAGAGELAVLNGAVLGACLGFLWYNFYPAQIFMGDTGSMALGGLLATVVILLKQEMLFVIVGGVFVLEGMSVLLQEKIGIGWLGRRLFFRAPIHHSFQHRGVAETKVVIRFWIVALILAFIGLLSLKIR
jgi:phospho-N-acetylmuramoyl-pentapeptide-transferase